jgi:hypothetical protein
MLVSSAVFTTIIAAASVAIAASAFIAAKYGVSATLPSRWHITFQGNHSDGSYQVNTSDTEERTVLVAFINAPQPKDFSGVADWVERHEAPDLFDWYSEHYKYKVTDPGEPASIPIGSGQTASLRMETLTINGNVRNVAFIYGATDKAWFYFFLGNHGKQANLDDDIKAVAAGIKVE